MIFVRMLKGFGFIALAVLSTLAITALLIIGFYAYGFYFAFAVVLAVVIGMIAYMVRKFGRAPERGRTVIRIEADVPLYWHDCNECTAGTQTLYAGSWGPIPMHLRTTQDGIRMFHPPRGNARHCTNCRGRGGWLLPYAPVAKEGEEVRPLTKDEIAALIAEPTETE